MLDSKHPLSLFAGAPRWWFYILLPLIHFVSVKLTFLCAVTPENVVVVWLPNAVLLAALMRFRGQRAWLMGALTLSSDILANIANFSPEIALQLSIVNLGEVCITFLLLQRSEVSDLRRLNDLRKFILAGPVVAAALAGVVAAAVLKLQLPTDTPYFTLMRLWWFGDALGLMIYTPLLLALTRPNDISRVMIEPPSKRECLGLATIAVLAFLIYSVSSYEMFFSPTLVLPIILYIAVRFGIGWSALAVSFVSINMATLSANGYRPFGTASRHAEIILTQEFILTASIIGIGFSILINELRLRENFLEQRIRARTSELEQSNRKLMALSQTDGLTGIANRRYFDTALSAEWDRARRLQQPLAVVMIDVDHFKAYNDNYGHQAGDDCLRTIANELNSHIRRAGDIVARYGGEEFAILAPNMNLLSIHRLAETICHSLKQKALPHVNSPLGVVTASIGVAVLIPDIAATPQHLLQLADAALYRAKRGGRNQVSC